MRGSRYLMRLKGTSLVNMSQGAAHSTSTESSWESYNSISVLRIVYSTKPCSYWVGRFVSLTDRLMNEEPDIPSPQDVCNKQTTSNLVTRRYHRALVILERCCRSDSVRESFLVGLSTALRYKCITETSAAFQIPIHDGPPHVRHGCCSK